jgi:hypothetical protein
MTGTRSLAGTAPRGRESAGSAGLVRSGAIAGLASVIVFTWVHQVLISDIWFALVPMLAAGALCGACVAWTYGLLFPVWSSGSWLRYNLAYLVLFVVLGAVSVVVFAPIATVTELTAMGGNPGELIGRAVPLMLAWVPASAILVTRVFGGGRAHFGPIVVAAAVLTLFLGHNVAIIGLVEFGANELFLLAEFAFLIAVINAVFVAAFLALERRRLLARGGAPAGVAARVDGHD